MAVEDPWELLDRTTTSGADAAGSAVVGTPDELVAMIRRLQDVTGGFGTVLGFCHDWADREATLRSWDLVRPLRDPRAAGHDAPACGPRSSTCTTTRPS